MSDVLFIRVRGAGRPMRVRVERRPGRFTLGALRRMTRAGLPVPVIAGRLRLRPAYVAAVMEGRAGLGGPAPLGGAAWSALVTAAAREVA